MIREIVVEGRVHTLRPTRAIGKGGEADVYDLGDGRAAKIWKTPDHPDLDGLPEQQRAAAAHLAAMPAKLAALARPLPPEIVAPIAPAELRSGALAGFVMPLVDAAEPLFRYAEPSFRKMVAGARVVALFDALRRVVVALHHEGIFVGDFNDRNVLVTAAGAPRLVDADSLSLPGSPCTVYTETFCDPRLAPPGATAPSLAAPYDAASDAYAFAVLLFQSLLAVGPYGGVFRPADAADRVPPRARPLRRVSILRQEIAYPKAALALSILPDELLHYFHRVFEADWRALPDRELLAKTAFARCGDCGVEHARRACPLCALASRSTATSAFAPGSRVLLALAHALLFVSLDERGAHAVAHDGEAYVREDGSVVVRGGLDPRARVATLGRATLLGRGGSLAIVDGGGRALRLSVDETFGDPAFTTNGRRLFYVAGGALYRHDPSTLDPAGRQLIGEVLANQTRIWVGPTFGFGFYRAGALVRAFSWDVARRGIRDFDFPRPIRGEIVAARATLDESRVWLLLTGVDRGVRQNLCVVFGRDGALLAEASSPEGDEGWLGAPLHDGGLGRPHAAVAAEGCLFVATVDGIARVEVDRGALRVGRTFDVATEGAALLRAADGLALVHRSRVLTLTAAPSPTSLTPARHPGGTP